MFRSSGNGGQSVIQRTLLFVLPIYPLEWLYLVKMKIPAQEQRQSAQNFESKALDNLIQEQQKEIAEDRRNQVGTGDRSERIRTYNFPQGRITDHRINLTLYKLDSFMDGDLQEMIEALITTDQAKKMAAVSS